MLAGRPVELHTADTGGNPAQARTKTQELVERLNVAVLIGPLAAFEALAIDDYVRSSRTPILSVAGAEDMTQRKPNPWFVRAELHLGAAQPSGRRLRGQGPQTTSASRRSPTTSRSATRYVAGFQRVFEDNGGKVVQKLWTPLNAPDYGTLHFPVQAQPRRRVTRRMPARTASSSSASCGNTATRCRSSAASRRSTSRCCSRWATTRSAPSPAAGIRPQLDFPINKTFVEAIQPRLQDRPRRLRGRDLRLRRGARARASRAINGKVEDKDAFMKALQGGESAEYPARPGALRRVRQRGRQHLHPQGREEGRQATSTP